MTWLNTGLQSCLIWVLQKDGLSVFVTIIEQICDVQMTKRELKILPHGNFHTKFLFFSDFTSSGMIRRKRYTWGEILTTETGNHAWAWLVNRDPDGSGFNVHWGAWSHLSHTQRPHDGYRSYCAYLLLLLCRRARVLQEDFFVDPHEAAGLVGLGLVLDAVEAVAELAVFSLVVVVVFHLPHCLKHAGIFELATTGSWKVSNII